jgi:hypothetical protein
MVMRQDRLVQYSDHATGWTTGSQFPAGVVIFFSSPPREDGGRVDLRNVGIVSQHRRPGSESSLPLTPQISQTKISLGV